MRAALCGLLNIQHVQTTAYYQRATALWSGSTTASKTLYVHTEQPLTGFNPFLGSCWGYMPCHAKTQTSLLQFLALLLLYLAKLQLILGLLWIILCQQLRQL